MMLNAFFTIVFIVSAVLFFVPSLYEANQSPGWGLLVLVTFVLIYAFAHAQRLSLVKAIFRAGVPVAALFIFAISRGGGDPEGVQSLIGLVLLISIVLFGIYRMVYGVMPKKTKRDWERDA